MSLVTDSSLYRGYDPQHRIYCSSPANSCPYNYSQGHSLCQGYDLQYRMIVTVVVKVLAAERHMARLCPNGTIQTAGNDGPSLTLRCCAQIKDQTLTASASFSFYCDYLLCSGIGRGQELQSANQFLSPQQWSSVHCAQAAARIQADWRPSIFALKSRNLSGVV